MNMHHEVPDTGAMMALKTAPPLGVIGANFVGLTVSDWIQWLTLLYIVVMVSHKLWSWWREWKIAKAVDQAKKLELLNGTRSSSS